MVEKGKTAHVHYTGKFDSGEVFDSSEGRSPLTFKVGAQQVVPGFDKAVSEMNVGDKKSVVIAPKDAYGEPRKELTQEVPREALGDMKDKVEVGMMLGVHHPAAPQPIPAKVTNLTEETVTLDMNHPLAGKTLHFDIELVKVDDSEVEEHNHDDEEHVHGEHCNHD